MGAVKGCRVAFRKIHAIKNPRIAPNQQRRHVDVPSVKHPFEQSADRAKGPGSWQEEFHAILMARARRPPKSAESFAFGFDEGNSSLTHSSGPLPAATSRAKGRQASRPEASGQRRRRGSKNKFDTQGQGLWSSVRADANGSRQHDAKDRPGFRGHDGLSSSFCIEHIGPGA